MALGFQPGLGTWAEVVVDEFTATGGDVVDKERERERDPN